MSEKSIDKALSLVSNTLNSKALKIFEEGWQYITLKQNNGKNWMKDETKVFIIDKDWLKSWKEYVNYQNLKLILDSQKIQYEVEKNKPPPEINNHNLIYNIEEFFNDRNKKNPDNFIVRHNIDQQKKIKLIKENVWNFFYKIYGGGPLIQVPIMEERIKNSNTIKRYVELYLNRFLIFYLPKRDNLNEKEISKTKLENIFFSKRKLVSELKGKLINLIEKSSNLDEYRLWRFNSINAENDIKLLLKKFAKNEEINRNLIEVHYLEFIDTRLENLNIRDTEIILIENISKQAVNYFEIPKIEFREGVCPNCNDEVKKMLINPCSCKEVWYCSESCKDSQYIDHQSICKTNGLDEDDLKKTQTSKNGVIGLQNLGNTCFMNTALQCLSNCWELTCYLLKNYFKDDINLVNPIGTKGIQARAYANLVKNLWYGEKNYYTPVNFKRVISKFQPTFAGYTQHDTQEFLNSLLDGLHEDLNRVLKKPMVPKDESKKADNVKSLEQWYSFLLRNQSLIVDLFYGQYKSILYCPNEKCQNISTTFEPFLSLTLPLTNRTEPYEIICFFIFYDISITPIQLNIQFSSECTIMAFRNKLAKILNVHPFSFFIVKMDSGGNYDHLVSSSSLLKINNYYTNNNQRPFFLFQIDPNLFYTMKNKFYNLDYSNKAISSGNSFTNPIELQDKVNKLKFIKYENRDFNDTYETLQKNTEHFKYLFKEDYEEDESNHTVESLDSYYSKINIISKGEPALGVMKINTDDNHGFDPDHLRLVVHLTYYNLEKSDGDNIIRDRIIFPRIVYVNSEWTLENMYNVLIEYFLPKLNIKNKERKNSSPRKSIISASSNFSSNKNVFNEIYKKYFSYLNTEKDYTLTDMKEMQVNDFYEFQKKTSLPFRVRVKNIMTFKNQACIFCEKIDCSGCLLPASRKIKIKDIISKYPKSDTGLKIDNTYLYLADYQREHQGKWNRDFSIELSWLPEYKPELYKLNDKVDSDFKIQRSEISKGISIYECFKRFIKLEKLEEKNEWYCSNCKSHQCATKKMEIYKSPHILIIHLKRFKNLNKLDRLVDFPIVELDISPFVINKNEFLPLTYDLFAVSNHVGSADFGHYYSYAKNPCDNQWYKYDDANVTPISQNEIVTSSAYVLFYRRKNLENLIDLQELYKKSFVNYEPLIQSVEENLQLISRITSCSFDSD